MWWRSMLLIPSISRGRTRKATKKLFRRCQQRPVVNKGEICSSVSTELAADPDLFDSTTLCYESIRARWKIENALELLHTDGIRIECHEVSRESSLDLSSVA